MELEFKHIVPYGENLGLVDSAGVFMTLEGYDFANDSVIAERINYKLTEIKPVLKPLSYLTKKELIDQGFIHHIDYLTHEREIDPVKFYIEGAPYEIIVYLLSKHYDVFGLIEKGLAIDINKLKPF